MKRVVADTNILVSALQFGGKPKQVLDLAIDGQVDLCISEAILAEALRVLGDKFGRTPEWLVDADRLLRVVARLVTPSETLQVIVADPSDDRILECAVAADAEVILSGDAHLLRLGSFRGSHPARRRVPQRVPGTGPRLTHRECGSWRDWAAAWLAGRGAVLNPPRRLEASNPYA